MSPASASQFVVLNSSADSLRRKRFQNSQSTCMQRNSGASGTCFRPRHCPRHLHRRLPPPYGRMVECDPLRVVTSNQCRESRHLAFRYALCHYLLTVSDHWRVYLWRPLQGVFVPFDFGMWSWVIHRFDWVGLNELRRMRAQV